MLGRNGSRIGGYVWLVVAFLAHSSALSPSLRAETAFLSTPALNSATFPFAGSKIFNGQHRRGLDCQRRGLLSLRLQVNPRGDDEANNQLAPKNSRGDNGGKQEVPKLEFDQDAFQFGFKFAEAFDNAQGKFEANYRQGIPVGSILSLGFFALLLSGQLNWVFGVVNFLFISAILVPLGAILAINLWVKSSIVDGECPSCGAQVMLAKGQSSRCLQCGTPLFIENGNIARVSQYNTQTDVQTGRQSSVDVVDVEVKAVDVEVLDPKDP